MSKKTSPNDVFVADFGFSALKWKHGNNTGRIVSAFTRHDTNYILGEDALIGSGSNYLKTPEELVKMYPWFIEQAVKEACLPACNMLPLAIGLPYTFWRDESEKDSTHQVSAIQQLKQVLKKEPFSEVYVFPQGLGGIVSYLNEKPATDGNILGIDVGFNTVISTLYSRKANKLIYGKTFYKRGVHQMAVNLLLPKIKHHIPGRSLTPVEVSYLMEKGFIQYGLDQIPILREIEESAAIYMNDTLSDIVEDLRAHLGAAADFSEVLFFGGGVRHFPGIDSKKVVVTVLQEPEFANADGFAQLAIQELGEES